MSVKDYAEQLIKKANELKNPATGERLGDILKNLILSCSKAAETEEELLDCIDDALNKLLEVAREVKK